jgi:hypothetical protein
MTALAIFLLVIGANLLAIGILGWAMGIGK